MRQTRSRTKALSLPADVPELEKQIDTLTLQELRKLLRLRSTDKGSLSSLRAKANELLRTSYLEITPRLRAIIESHNNPPILPQVYSDPRSIAAPSTASIIAANNHQPYQTPAARAVQLPPAPIASYLYEYQQFAAANNNNIQFTQPPNYRSHQPIHNGTMYQSNLGMVPSSGNNGVLPHTNGMVGSYAPVQGLAPNLPIHPDVRLKKLAFFDVLAVLLKPSTLIPTSASQRMQENTYQFSLTPAQATEIGMNRDTRNSNKVEHVVQVQLRFCLLETSCEQEDYFPPNVVVKVNSKLQQLPNPIPTNKPGVEPKRPPRPVNVTTNVKLSPTVINNITVSWCSDYNRGFVISAYLVKKLTSSQLLQRMKDKGIKPIDYTRGLIKEKLNEDADCEIATTMLRVSLICPLGKMRMTTPCRASTCSHLQCFDASLFLQMNERKPTWNCPVCDKPAVYETLVIDGYFQDVLSSNRLPSDINEIQLLKDGSWITHEAQNELQTLDTPRKSMQKIEISDDVEIISDDSPKSSIKKQSENGENNGTTAKPSEPMAAAVSVDLTLSDSDEDVVPVHRKANSTIQSTASSKGRSGTPVITNDTVISLDSPSPPSSPSPLGARALPTSSSDLNTELIQALSYGDPSLTMNPFTAFGDIAAGESSMANPFTSSGHAALNRSDPLLIYKQLNWLNQRVPSTDWSLGPPFNRDSNEQNRY